MSRVNAVLVNYFEPDHDAETKANARAEFVHALSGFPEWAMQRAFDVWVKRHSRRPSPGEIVILADAELKPLRDEVKRREAMSRIEPPRPDRVTPEAAARILGEFGFTPDRLAGVLSGKPRHWTDAVPAGDEGDAELIRNAKKEGQL